MNREMLLGVSIWFVTETRQTVKAKGMKIMQSNLLLRAGFSRAGAQSSVLLGIGFFVNVCINLFTDPSRQFMFA